MNILILGGSGFLSGTLARVALEAGHQVTTITRGERPLSPGLRSIRADRNDETALASALESEGSWDLVVDSIAYTPAHARQDVALFSGRCGRFVFISTDFVYDPPRRKVPQPEEGSYISGGYGGLKREAEEVLELTSTDQLPWSIFRPGHIYGPGSHLGSLPLHSRDPLLLERLRRGETLQLLGGGTFLLHPVFAPDLARTILSVPDKAPPPGKIWNVANPDVAPSHQYYKIIADILGVKLTVQAIPVDTYLKEYPDKVMFCCDRVYDLSQLRTTGLEVPATTLEEGLLYHVSSLL